MQDKFFAENTVNADGNPFGGRVEGNGLGITWQQGPLVREDGTRREPNGAFVETVIAAARQRIAFYQSSKFACRENAMALQKIDEALMWLDARTKKREAAGVEGTWKTTPPAPENKLDELQGQIEKLDAKAREQIQADHDHRTKILDAMQAGHAIGSTAAFLPPAAVVKE